MISFFRRLLRVGVPAEAIGQENEANLRLMMDNSVDVILRVGPDLLRYVSPSSLQLFGWTILQRLDAHLHLRPCRSLQVVYDLPFVR